MNELLFTKDVGNAFFETLKKRVNTALKKKKYSGFIYYKIFFYFFLLLCSYFILLSAGDSTLWIFYSSYITTGIIVLLIVFNISHDAAHGTIFKNSRWNKFLYYISFTLLGNHPYLWKKYHLCSHHVYTNIEGSDIDVIQNRFVRLNKNEPLMPWHKYQHIYAPVLYLFYTMNFVFFRDLLFLLGKSDRTIQISICLMEKLKYAFYKSIYLIYFLLVPFLLVKVSPVHLLSAFVLTHFVCSIVIILFLACNHQVDETSHYGKTDDQRLNKSWVSIQMSSSLDYNPESRFLNFILGGFNAHTVHHLFPTVCHVQYPEIVPILRKTAQEFNIKYQETTFPKALASHFRFLKKMGYEK